MEKIRLEFDVGKGREEQKVSVEVPGEDGVVVTSEFCPVELMAGRVDLLAAMRGEKIENFAEGCRRQANAMKNLTDIDSEIDRHIGALMAVVMDHLCREKRLEYKTLLNLMDCFSLLMKGAGFDEAEIRAIYPRITKTICDLYPEQIIVANFANRTQSP